MGRLKILTFCVAMISGFWGTYNIVNADWLSTLGAGLAAVTGAKCDTFSSYTACRESNCKNEGLTNCKKFCPTNAEIIKYRRPCACGAGLTAKNCPQSSGEENDLVVALNRKCRSLWAQAKTSPKVCGFCQKYRDKCTNIEGIFDWCSEKCPDKDNEEDDNADHDDDVEHDDDSEGDENT